MVVSLWESDRCVGTFQLPVADAPQLMVLLAEAVKAWAAQPQPAGRHIDTGTGGWTGAGDPTADRA